MRTIDYSVVFGNVLNLCGIESDAGGANQVVPGRVLWKLVRDFASNRLKYGWEAARWPEVCVQESRAVTVSGGVEGNYVALDQAGQNEIATVFEVRNKNPKQSQDSIRLGYYLSENGVQLDGAATTVWMHYRKHPPRLTGDLYSKAVGANYAIGGQAYDGTLGNFYTALEVITGDGTTVNSPSAAPAKWALVEIPDVLRNYLIKGVYSDYLRHDGRMDQSHPAERDATAVLEHEVIQLEAIQGQNVRYEFVGQY